MTFLYKVAKGDCIKEMAKIPDDSVDFVLTDLPYGTTACKWDSIIPFEPMWNQIWRIVKPDAAVAFFGSEPFSTKLRMSSFDQYKYDWYWDKKKSGNFVQAKRMPLKVIENVMIFSKGKTLPAYYPQMTLRDKPIQIGSTKTAQAIPVKNKAETHPRNKKYHTKYPVTQLSFDKDHSRKRIHPTQKPVKLLEYLIKTYTSEDEIVLDFTMGSGSTGVAAINQKRRFIGFDNDDNYFSMARERIKQALEDQENELKTDDT